MRDLKIKPNIGEYTMILRKRLNDSLVLRSVVGSISGLGGAATSLETSYFKLFLGVC